MAAIFTSSSGTQSGDVTGLNETDRFLGEADADKQQKGFTSEVPTNATPPNVLKS